MFTKIFTKSTNWSVTALEYPTYHLISDSYYLGRNNTVNDKTH